jgi:hypothetical protein
MGNVNITNELSSRPERTRISYHVALDKAACAPFRRARRMKFAEATNPNRIRGSVVEGPAVPSTGIQLTGKPVVH